MAKVDVSESLLFVLSSGSGKLINVVTPAEAAANS